MCFFKTTSLSVPKKTATQAFRRIQLHKFVGETKASCYYFQLVTFCETYDRCIISVDVYIKFTIRVNKIYYAIDIPRCSKVDVFSIYCMIINYYAGLCM